MTRVKGGNVAKNRRRKVLNIRKSGSISVTHQGGLHNTGKQSAKRSRQKRNKSELHKSDYKRIKDLI